MLMIEDAGSEKGLISGSISSPTILFRLRQTLAISTSCDICIYVCTYVNYMNAVSHVALISAFVNDHKKEREI